MFKIRILKPAEFDIRIIQAVRAIRELRRMKQVCIALELGMTESNYCKIENGYKAISISQLKKIAKSLDVSVFLIFALAESDQLLGQNLVPLSNILVKFTKSLQDEKQVWSEDEVSFILSKIDSPKLV